MSNLINNIQNAFNNELNDVPLIPEIAFPNVKYVPRQSVDYARPTLLPAKGSLATLQYQSVHEGIYQVDIYTQLDKGTAPLLTIADAIRNYFILNNVLVSGGDTVHVQEISMSQAQRIESWWSCYVQITYICFN